MEGVLTGLEENTGGEGVRIGRAERTEGAEETVVNAVNKDGDNGGGKCSKTTSGLNGIRPVLRQDDKTVDCLKAFIRTSWNALRKSIFVNS